MELLKTNPLIGSILPLYIAGMMTFLFRNVPMQIWTVFKNQTTTTLSLLGPLEDEAIHRYIERVFPEHPKEDRLQYAPITGATLQKLYIQHHRSYRDFIAMIPVVNPDTRQLPIPEEVV